MANKQWLHIHGWDIPRWRLSTTFRELSPLARYAYRELCDQCYLDGSIPDDPAQCAAIISLPAEEMTALWPALRSRFRKSKKPGRLHHPTVSMVRSNAIARMESATSYGRSGGREKAKRMMEIRRDTNRQSIPTLPYPVSVSVSSLEFKGERKCETIGGNSGRYDPDSGWSRFKQEYPHIRSEQRALHAWLSVCESAETEAAIFAGLEVWKESNEWARGVFNDAARWLMDRMWTAKPAPIFSKPPKKAAGVDL